DLVKVIHHVEQTGPITLIETLESKFLLPSAKGSVVATTLGLVDVAVAHCRGATNDMGGADLFPVLPRRIVPQTAPCFLSFADGRISWIVQLIIDGTCLRFRRCVARRFAAPTSADLPGPVRRRSGDGARAVQGCHETFSVLSTFM